MKWNRSLIGTIIVLFFIGIIFPKNSFGQRHYQDLYVQLEDTVYSPRIELYKERQNPDSLIIISEEAYHYYLENGEKDKAIFHLINGMHYAVGFGETKKSMPIIKGILDGLHTRSDTLNVHYATLLQIYAFGEKFDYKMKEAEPIYRNVIAIYKKVDAPNILLWGAYQSLGSVLIYLDKTWEGYQLFKVALEGFKKENQLHDIAFSYLEIARAMGATGQDELAFFAGSNGLKILSEHFPQSFNTVVIASNLADQSISIGKYDEALQYANFADSLIHKYDNVDRLFQVYFSILANRGIAYKKSGNYKEANKNFRELLFQIKKYMGDDSPFVIDAYNEIALNYQAAGELDSALMYFDKYKTIDTNYQMNLYDALADVYFEKGETEKSIQLMEKYFPSVLQNKEKKIDINNYPHPDSVIDPVIAYHNASFLARYYLEMYKKKQQNNYLDACLTYSNLSNILIEKYRNATLIGANDERLAMDYHDIAEVGIEASYLAFQNKKQEKFLNSFLKYITQSTAFKLNAEVSHIQAPISEDGKDTNAIGQIHLLQKIRQLENKLVAMEKKPDEELKNQITEQLFEYKIKAFELSYQLQNRNSIVSEELFSDITYKELQKNLSEEDALVIYFKSETELYSVFIAKEKVKINKIDLHNTFDKDLKGYYKALKTGSRQLPLYAKKMYSYLIQPFKEELDNKSNLSIIPEENLNQVPFESLVFSENGKDRFLIENFSISYNYSALLWLRSRELPKNDELSFVGFAPVFSQEKQEIDALSPLRYDEEVRSEYADIRRGNSLQALPYSETEVTEIASLFEKAKKKEKVFLYEDANEQNFKNNIETFSIAHIATHSYSSKKDPQLSGLFLSKKKVSEDITDDGFVYLGELFTLKSDADLIVLSACKTGSGKITKGEGIIALPRAFLFTGVPNIIASLWKIHDKKTKNLMVDFYRYLLEGDTYSQALRKAKLIQIKKGELPMDWSGLILIGE